MARNYKAIVAVSSIYSQIKFNKRLMPDFHILHLRKRTVIKSVAPNRKFFVYAMFALHVG